MNILIATPVRRGTKDVFLGHHKELVAAFTYRDIEEVAFENDPVTTGGKYSPNANARNSLIEAHLKDHHTHVLWMDVDLVSAPTDLIEWLLVLSNNHGGGVAAPFVLIDHTEQFYDVGGFIQNGNWFSPQPPYCDGGDIVHLDSVGTCYLIPASVYRCGGVYAPIGDEVEHLSLMRQARGMGLRVVAQRSLVVRHAYLPDYGLWWH